MRRIDGIRTALRLAILTAALVLWAGALPTTAADGDLVYFQGYVMDLGKNVVFINERPVTLTAGTQIMADGAPVEADRLVLRQWIAVEAESSPSGRVAKRIVLLPGRFKEDLKLLFIDGTESE